MVKIGKRDKTLSVTFVATHLFSGWRVINYPSRDGPADQIDMRRNVKNGQILPTGQWYAPSAVIIDALIMP